MVAVGGLSGGVWGFEWWRVGFKWWHVGVPVVGVRELEWWRVGYVAM